MEALTTIYLIFVFIAIYMLSFFILVLFKNRGRLFWYPKPKKQYTLSFLVPAYNEENTIQDTILSLLNLDYPKERLEIIAINDGSTDNTANIIKKMAVQYPNLKLLDKPNTGKADSLNCAIEIAKGELIAITDSDSFPEPDALNKIVGFFNDEKVAAVTSAVFLRNKEKFFEKVQAIEYFVLAWTRKLLDFVDSVYVTNGPLSVYRAEALRKIGGFDPKNITEDIEVTWHLLSEGYKTRMSLGAHVYTVAPNKLKSWWRQRVRWGVGGIQTISKYKKYFFSRGVFGIFIIPYVSVSIILSIFTFFLTVYILSRSFLLTFLSATYSIHAQTILFSMQEVNLTPPVMLFFIVILFVLGLVYTLYILTFFKTDQLGTGGIRKILNSLFYLLIYLTIYPVVWIPSIYNSIIGRYKW